MSRDGPYLRFMGFFSHGDHARALPTPRQSRPRKDIRVVSRPRHDECFESRYPELSFPDGVGLQVETPFHLGSPFRFALLGQRFHVENREAEGLGVAPNLAEVLLPTQNAR